MSERDLHALLREQLEATFGQEPHSLPESLVRLIDDSYRQWEKDRDLLEQTLELTGEELLDRNQALLDQVLQQERIAEELGQSMSLLRGTLEATGDGILGIDMNGRVITHNRHLIEMWDLDEALLANGDGRAVLDQMVARVRNPEAWRRDLDNLQSSPEVEWLDMVELSDGRAFERYTQPQRLGEHMVGRIWSFRDVSERYRLEAQMRQSQKLEAVGRLAGGIAHDFNNLLTVISGCCSLLALLPPEDGAKSRELVDEIRGAAKRAADLTRQLLTFSRQQVMDPRPVDLQQVIREMEGMLDRLLGDDIHLACELEAPKAVVMTDPVQIQQVVLNLAINARDAMPHGGTITLGTSTLAVSDEGQAFGQGWLKAGHYLLFRAADTGEGIPAATLAHVFEPFFTTKGDSGTGLGLATVYGIVVKSGGLIEVVSEVGEGTEFRVAMPLIEQLPDEKDEVVTESVPAAEGARILVVEDNDTVRLILQESLEQLGHSVVAEATPRSALQNHLDSIQGFDLLLTDIMMPELNGYEMAEQLRRAWPSLRILFVTGYVADIERPEALTDRTDLLSKPFELSVLDDKINQLLALPKDLPQPAG